MTLISAYTDVTGQYPGFVNIKRESDGGVTVTVRSAPAVRQGAFICAHEKDAAPGRCVAGGPTCNNYCNMAPEKGPMADRPLACEQVTAGSFATFTLSREAWSKVLADLVRE